MIRFCVLLVLLAAGNPALAKARKPAAGKSTAAVAAVIVTSLGDIPIELDAAHAPITVENFLRYARDGFYDGTIFHRLVPGFVIQGGGYTKDGDQKPTRPPIHNEAQKRLRNLAGTLSMARTSDPGSATSQFFISLKDNPSLDARPGSAGYAVFGHVTGNGMKVVEKIAAARTGPGPGPGFSDWPIEPVIIKSVRAK